MKADASHIRQIKVVSNTHWDREFRRSFEKTRRRLLVMLDTTLDVLEHDPDYHSYTMDGHSIMIDDYLEMRPERRAQVERLVRDGRLIIGPWYTLPEQFSLGHEALVRNLLWGRKTTRKYGGKPGSVAYTPASWGQTGQLPQILAGFGLKRMMFYRGVSHDECDAEYVWVAPDGSQVLSSRFALYARYNWYYQVHRPVTTGRVFSKDYLWGERDEVPFRFADGLAGEDLAFELKAPSQDYDKSRLKQAIEEMVRTEGPHFTTEVFLAMNGHDISVAFPRESEVIRDAQQLLTGRYTIEHTDLEAYWQEMERHLDRNALPWLTGERRSYLKKGKWTYLMPSTISARSYLKLQDFRATAKLVYGAEPLACLAWAFGDSYPRLYLDRGWAYLLSNHTHDANGGCAPDSVCLDMEYRYRATSDVADIVSEDAMAFVAKQLSPEGQSADAMQLLVYNSLPMERDEIVEIDLEVPRPFGARAVALQAADDPSPERQPISWEKSSSFVDSIWDVPTILDSDRIRFYARVRALPALGWRTYTIAPEAAELRSPRTLISSPTSMENEFLHVEVNSNGTVDITNRTSGRVYRGLNYLLDQGECGNAWNHVAPRFDRSYSSVGVSASIAVKESGPLVSSILVRYEFPVPADYGDGTSRSATMVALPVQVEYRLKKYARQLEVVLTVENRAKDHWLRAAFPTGLATDETWADSHFDVVSRPIPLPDSTGWVEQAMGTHPLRTFVAMSDGSNGLALLPKGSFEYEAFEDQPRTLALTLIRACRIKLMVSEEKQAELPDLGIQCPGVHRFEYAIHVHEGDWRAADLLAKAALYYTPVRVAMTGRGQGSLPRQASLLHVANANLHVTCIKAAEDGRGIVVRFFNPLEEAQTARLLVGRKLRMAERCRMDESPLDTIHCDDDTTLSFTVDEKKIVTLRLMLQE